MNKWEIKPVHLSDALEICVIYNRFIEDSIITFELESITPEVVKERIEQITQNHPWLVLKVDNHIAGYAYASYWRSRPAYAKTAETAIYLDPEYSGKGLGTLLYKALIDELNQGAFHRLIGVISLPNPESIRFHEKLGFVKAGHFTEVGRKFDKWIDVEYWELKL